MIALWVVAADGHITLPSAEPALPFTGPRVLEAPVATPVDMPDGMRVTEGLEIVLVTGETDRAIWSTLLDREHSRGVITFAGAQRRYLIKSAASYLGAARFSAAALFLKARDMWMAWDHDQRGSNLKRVVNLSRFLIRPSVRCQNLASFVFRRLPSDFRARYKYAP